MQIFAPDSCQYSNNMTTLCIWTWERCKQFLWKWL